MAVEKWKVKAYIVQHMAAIIKLGGKSAKQAMLNWALRLSSQGAKREWPCKKMKVYSCETELCVCVCVCMYVCVCIFACIWVMYSCERKWLCVRAWAVLFMPRNGQVVRVCLFVLRVCASEWEIYAGKLDIIACVCARHACTCIQGNRYILSVCVCSACVWIMFSDAWVFLRPALSWTS